MSIDDYFREQRRFKVLMGIGQTASAIAEAHRAMPPSGGLFGNGHRSAAEEIALGLQGNALGSVGTYLRRLQQPDPNTLRRPAHEAIVKGLLRAVDLARYVRPTATGFQYGDNAAYDAPVVHPSLAPRIGGRFGAIFATCSSVSQK